VNDLLFEGLLSRLELREPICWVPRVDYTRIGKGWWASLCVPDPELVYRRSHIFKGYGRTRRAALADLRHRLGKAEDLLRRARVLDLGGIAIDAVNDFTRIKMREDGFFRRIMPPTRLDTWQTPVRRQFAGWGPDGEATFRYVPGEATRYITPRMQSVRTL
jgi:hypothetical protein